LVAERHDALAFRSLLKGDNRISHFTRRDRGNTERGEERRNETSVFMNTSGDSWFLLSCAALLAASAAFAKSTSAACREAA
jgi:hypothetical protein